MILDQILADKRIEIEAAKARTSLEELQAALANAPPPRDFRSALRMTEGQSAVRGPKPAIRLIAEIKKASPSKGLIRADFDPVSIARSYEVSGASAISVLTDEKYFQGCLEYLTSAHQSVELPVLRKDFIVTQYQIYEARAAGADAILLIVAALAKAELVGLMAVADDLGMASLVEVHSDTELNAALKSGAKIIGINNRNLRTFETSLNTTLGLAAQVPADRVLISESGIASRTDVESLMEVGVDAILVGESLMRDLDPGKKVKELLGVS